MAQRLRFGVFDFDRDTGELRREGTPVKLQAQPAQVLGMLLAQADQIVTREQLREAVWGGETFVDFDRSINYCIAQIRSALGDSAESPRFIRTVPKRGYQFLGPVEGSAPAAPDPAAAARSSTRSKLRWLAAALVILAAGVGVAVAIERTRPINIAVVRFDNETGNPAATSYADRITDLVVTDLAADAPAKFRVIGNAAELRAGRDQRDLVKIGESLHARYVVIGQVQRNGANYRVLAHLIRLPGQTHLRVVRKEQAIDQGLPDEDTLSREITAVFLRRLRS